MTNTAHHFSIGAIDVSLRSDCRSFIDEYVSLYGPYHRSEPGDDAIEITIKSRGRFPWRRGPYVIQGPDGEGFEVRRRYEVLPHLEWTINWHVIRRHNEYAQLHAAALEIDGHALMMPGNPGSGKSTTAAGLLARGWRYLSDEFALIDPSSLEVQPFPRALCIKQPSFSVIDGLRLPLRKRTPYQKAAKGRVAFLNPLEVRPDATGRRSRVRWVVFPQYVAGATPTMESLPRSQAAYELTRQCFNFPAYNGRVVRIAADIVRQAECYRLIAGNIGATCDLIESRLLPQIRRKAG